MIDDLFDKNSDEEQESFASLLDSYSPSAERDLRVGDRMVGKIISIGKDTVFIDTGTKIDGAVDMAELTDKSGELLLKEGDEVELFIVALSEDEIKLSKAISGIGGLYMLREAHAKAVPVEGRVLETCKGGFRVEILQRRAFCPISQMDVEYVENPADYVGTTHQFLITQFEENGKNIVVSRRTLLAQKLAAARKQFYDSASVGDILNGKITRLMQYGAFVEISPGVEGMVHISELSWSKLKHPDELVSIGDNLQVKIIGLEPAENSDQIKVGLSAKQLLEDPWLSAGEHFQEGHKVQGKVTRCAPFGAFVEIAPGIEGLVHISEMSYLRRITKPEEIVSEGETVSVMIKEIDLHKRRISLSIRDAEGDPWLEVPDKFKVGQTAEGTIEKKESFGYFINLSPGVTGLLPKSNFKRSSEPGSLEKLREGDRLPVLVEMVNDKERKITLAPGDAAHEEDWQKYSGDAGNALGDLGEKLQQALASKKKP